MPNSLQGLDFGLGETADALRAEVARFAAAEIAPRAAEIDARNAFPARPLARARRARRCSGSPSRRNSAAPAWAISSMCVAMEEISRASASVGLSYGAHSNLCVNQIRRCGNAEQKRRYLPKLVSGEHVGALAMSRAGRGQRRGRHAPAGRQARRPLRAERQQDVDHQRPGRRDAGRLRQDRPGGRAARDHRLPGREGRSRASPPRRSSTSSACAAPTPASWCSEDCEVPEENVLGQVGGGVGVLMSGLDYERAVLAAGPLGIMQACLDVVLPYVHERKQFGQPIGAFQLMQAQDRRHVHGDERRPRLRLRRGQRLRPRADDAQGRGRRDPVRRGEGDLDGARGDPGAGRQRLHQRLPDRAAACATPSSTRSAPAPARSGAC